MLVHAVNEREKRMAWTNTNEGLAAAVEALWAILARLEVGIATVQVKRIGKPKDNGRFPRPPWLTEGEVKELVVHHVADAIKVMRGESRGN